MRCHLSFPCSLPILSSWTDSSTAQKFYVNIKQTKILLVGWGLVGFDLRETAALKNKCAGSLLSVMVFLYTIVDYFSVAI